MFCVALASLVLATSCSQDDLQTAKFSQNTINPNVELGGQPISTFAAAKGKAVKSRAVETTITNLGSFTMNAFQDGEANYMKDVKYTSTEMIHIGFPLTSLDTHQDSFRLISKDENTCTIEPVDILPQMTFEEWKNSIETTISNNKGANLMLPKGTSPTDEYIINKVRSFNIESKTPMDCMMFLVDLKKKINGEV